MPLRPAPHPSNMLNRRNCHADLTRSAFLFQPRLTGAPLPSIPPALPSAPAPSCPPLPYVPPAQSHSQNQVIMGAR